MGYFYIFGTILFTVYGQIILKWRLNTVQILPSDFFEKLLFLLKLLLDPWIISGFVSALIASFFWMAAMTKFDLSFAYPFMSGAFVLVFMISIWLFNAPVSWQKILGLAFIVLGTIITSRGM